MEAELVYRVLPHKKKSTRRIIAVAQRLDNLANNIGEMFKRDLAAAPESAGYDDVFNAYNDFYVKTAKEIYQKDIYAQRYLKINFEFFKDNYGVLRA